MHCTAGLGLPVIGSVAQHSAKGEQVPVDEAVMEAGEDTTVVRHDVLLGDAWPCLGIFELYARGYLCSEQLRIAEADR